MAVPPCKNPTLIVYKNPTSCDTSDRVFYQIDRWMGKGNASAHTARSCRCAHRLSLTFVYFPEHVQGRKDFSSCSKPSAAVAISPGKARTTEPCIQTPSPARTGTRTF